MVKKEGKDSGYIFFGPLVEEKKKPVKKDVTHVARLLMSMTISIMMSYGKRTLQLFQG